jgi:acyl phosphate:glycerol-3-phosphate acyltransferase
MMPLVALVIAFLIGGIPFGYLLVRLKTGEDVREKGSGNIGATNVLRTTGRGIAVATLLLDIGKGALAVWIADKLSGGSAVWMSLAALAVMAGHAYPVFLKFQGGKAVASFIGAFLYLTPVPMICALGVFVIVVAATRQISMGSIVAAGSLPLAAWLIEHPPLIVVLAALAAGAFLIYRHRANIARIRAGTENVFRFGNPR